MKIVVIGASGFVGEKIVLEALERKHEVIGIYKENAIKPMDRLMLHKLSIFEEEKFNDVLKEADVIVSAYNPGYYHVAQKERFLDGYEIIFKLAKKLGKRVVAVIGATSLMNYDGELVKNGFFPKPWLKALEGPDAVYEKYINDLSIDKTFISPPAELIEGKKTGKYRLGLDTIVYDENYESRISVQDLAVAIMDEVENPKHKGKRFTIAY